MKQRAALAHHLADGRDVIDCTQLVVDQHQRHQKGVIAHDIADGLRGDQAIGVRHQIGDLDARVLQLPGSVEDRLVFDLTGNDVTASNAARLGDALEGQVVGFSGAGGPDDLLSLGADQFGDLPSRLLDRLPGLLAECVGAGGRIAEVAVKAQTLDHDLDDSLIHRGGGGVVEIQWTFIHKRLAERVPGSGGS
ncbi:hypothetical protein D3C87_1248330 [compost metagenome]